LPVNISRILQPTPEKMKSILPLGIILISAIALSSCSSMNNLSKTQTIGDDVYYTKAKAGDSFDPVPQYTQNSYTNNDDYYYYGDYKSRIDRFSYLTPFDYNDDFYYDYTSNDYSAPANTSAAEPVDDGYYADAYDDLGVYSAFDFGYGDFGGYDNYGYGIAYSSYIYSGSGRISHKRSNDNGGSTNGRYFNRAKGSGGLAFNKPGVSSGSRPAPSTGLSFSRSNSTSANNNNTAYSGGRRPGGSYAVYPGRPGTNSTAYVNPTGNGSRIIRQDNQNTRPVIQQPTVERYSPPPSTSSSSSSSSSGSSGGGGGGGGAASGGGGRPVRP